MEKTSFRPPSGTILETLEFEDDSVNWETEAVNATVTWALRNMGTVLSFRNKHGNGNKSSGKRKSAGKTWGRKQKDRPHLPVPFTSRLVYPQIRSSMLQ